MGDKYTRQTHIPFDKQILTYVFYAATQCALIRVADVFGISEASVFNIIASLSELITKNLLREFIRWPEGNRVNDILHGFKEAQGFPGVIEAIDGSHVPIRAPETFPENYINRKGYHSINCMAVCDHEHFFTDIFIGWPGSTHDARVFGNSPLHTASTNHLENTFPQNCHMIGDSAYGLDNFIMVPFKDFGNLTRDQKNYNFKLSSTRMKTEHSFGILKGRFRTLKYIDMGDMEKLNAFISSCFVLHNITLTTEDAFDDFLADGLEGSDPDDPDVFHIQVRNESGVQKRITIVGILNEQNVP
ncbi:hypothetical protein SNE40_011219 [Patella caerulea]|uniref:Putative nuclease HARBI1 n=1 Tax=Patella caerulea TaxID=87958 RepID=A0AAN8PXJ9_PATCE